MDKSERDRSRAKHNKTKHHSRTQPVVRGVQNRAKWHLALSPLFATPTATSYTPPFAPLIILTSFCSPIDSAHARRARGPSTQQQRQANESPVLFYSVVLRFVGPVLVFGAPPTREQMGYRPPEPIPTTYLSAFLHRPKFYIHGLVYAVPKRPKTACAGLRRRGVKGA